jgi:dTDP-4-amino-4,6-dideoxygalactose transaminase
LFVIQTKNRKEIYQYLRGKGVITQVHYIPVVNHPYYHQEKLTNSNAFYQYCLSLPIYTDLTQQQQSKIIISLKQG